MNAKLVTAIFLAGALLAPIAVRAADSDADRANPEAFVKDSVITTKIKSKLAAEKMSSLVKIKVDTDRNGIVVLGGTATNQAAIDKAVTVARGTEGVTSVQNHIKIKADD